MNESYIDKTKKLWFKKNGVNSLAGDSGLSLVFSQSTALRLSSLCFVIFIPFFFVVVNCQLSPVLVLVVRRNRHYHGRRRGSALILSVNIDWLWVIIHRFLLRSVSILKLTDMLIHFNRNWFHSLRFYLVIKKKNFCLLII